MRRVTRIADIGESTYTGGIADVQYCGNQIAQRTPPVQRLAIWGQYSEAGREQQ